MKLLDIFTNDIKPGYLFNIPEQPVNIMLDVTNSCNNRCVYCYNPSDRSYLDDSPDPERLKKVVALIGEAGTKEILYLGGEPFAASFIGELIETGKNYGLFQRAVSNGSFFNDISSCIQLKDKGLDEVGISFHSSNPKAHDKISGRKGSFNDALLAVENCNAAGINTFIQYSPNTLNVTHDILLLTQYLKNNLGAKISFIDINRLLPMGQGKRGKNVFLGDDEWFQLLAMATGLYDIGLEVHAELTPFCWLRHKAEKYKTSDDTLERIFKLNRGCFMWVAQLPLDYKGRIKFCPTGTAVGPSILDVSWPVFWTEWKEFKKYRSFLWNNTCVDFDNGIACTYFYRCLGGCKYSRGTHYDIDKYAIDIENSYKGRAHGEEYKTKQSNHSERFAWNR